jgi:pyruvate/2-oxoacid:ferredoxin oxidoreductase alpha subunit
MVLLGLYCASNQIRTGVIGFKVQCANHYTIEAYLLTKEYRTPTPILFIYFSLSLFLDYYIILIINYLYIPLCQQRVKHHQKVLHYLKKGRLRKATTGIGGLS